MKEPELRPAPAADAVERGRASAGAEERAESRPPSPGSGSRPRTPGAGGPFAGAGRVPAARRHMPSDFSLALAPGRGADLPGLRGPEPIPGSRERRQSLRGFEEGYSDIVDWIVRITHRIWEDQDVGYIYDTYAPGARIHDDTGLKTGVEQLIGSTLQRIHAFPDCRHYADDVIWAGDDEQGFVTSHRDVNVGHHTGRWNWGEPTGRRLDTWVIANCVVRENEIYEEWVLYNTGSVLRQTGFDVREAARAHGNALTGPVLDDRQAGEAERLLGGRKPLPYPPAPEGSGFDVEHTVRALFHHLFNRRDLSAVDRAYAPTVRWYGASDRTAYGRGEVRAWFRSLVSTFPDLGAQVDEVYWMGNDRDGYRVSVRWSAVGTHRGWALYGEPTGRRVHLWGISQLYFVDGLVVEEWNLFNEFAVLGQLLRDEPGKLTG
ncbi:ester cyclase [Streptomyces sp. NPDC049954]|uniref:ester cyclase n=1 Tax=Streptomyces sp. NPDC049954 TaxID=3155779 RepID=UPI003434E38B